MTQPYSHTPLGSGLVTTPERLVLSRSGGRISSRSIPTVATTRTVTHQVDASSPVRTVSSADISSPAATSPRQSSSRGRSLGASLRSRSPVASYRGRSPSPPITPGTRLSSQGSVYLNPATGSPVVPVVSTPANSRIGYGSSVVYRSATTPKTPGSLRSRSPSPIASRRVASSIPSPASPKYGKPGAPPSRQTAPAARSVRLRSDAPTFVIRPVGGPPLSSTPSVSEPSPIVIAKPTPQVATGSPRRVATGGGYLASLLAPPAGGPVDRVARSSWTAPLGRYRVNETTFAACGGGELGPRTGPRAGHAPLLTDEYYETSRLWPADPLEEYGFPVAKLGSGAYGSVTKWRDHLGRSVAIKSFGGYGDTIAEDMSPSDEQQPYMEDNTLEASTIREVAILSRCKHPNIIGIIDVTYYQPPEGGVGQLRLVMPLAHTTLDTFIQKQWKDAPVEVAINIAHDLLSALDYLQKRDILHRDIKPANVLLVPVENLPGASERDALGITLPDGTKVIAKLADFGLAMTYGCVIPQGLTDPVYTLYYMPPEIAMNGGSLISGAGWVGSTYGLPADVWAMGCTLYELFTGRNPLFYDRTRRIYSGQDQYRLILTTLEEGKYIDEITEGMGGDDDATLLVIQMLELEPSDRITAADGLMNSIFNQAAASRDRSKAACAAATRSIGAAPSQCEPKLALRASQPTPYPAWKTASERRVDSKANYAKLWAYYISRTIGSIVFTRALWIYDATIVAVGGIAPGDEWTTMAAAVYLAVVWHGYRDITSSHIAFLTKSNERPPMREEDLEQTAFNILFALKFDLSQVTVDYYLYDAPDGKPANPNDPFAPPGSTQRQGEDLLVSEATLIFALTDARFHYGMAELAAAIMQYAHAPLGEQSLLGKGSKPSSNEIVRKYSEELEDARQFARNVVAAASGDGTPYLAPASQVSSQQTSHLVLPPV